MTDLPSLTQFRIEIDADDVAHLIFDCPGRTMNVFSDAAIQEIGAVAAWLGEAPVRGLLIRSGKANAFCAGADLTELGVAYDMIVAAPSQARFRIAFDHFFRLSTALRALETAGKPVAAAIAGLALGGGCELALAAHHRVLVDAAGVELGLPESLVGLLPGAGGTQRLPRLIGVEAALPVLLDGKRLGGEAALEAGLVNQLAESGREVETARQWLLSGPRASQPWDVADWQPVAPSTIEDVVRTWRSRVLAETQGHYPAPLAILDCVQFGLPQTFEGGIRTEMAIFAELIQREEPRNMIQTLFLAKTEHEKLKRKEALPDFVHPIVEAAAAAIAREDSLALAQAGLGEPAGEPVRRRAEAGYWIDSPAGRQSAEALRRVGDAVAPLAEGLTIFERRLADYAVIAATRFPGYTGGPLTLHERDGRMTDAVNRV